MKGLQINSRLCETCIFTSRSPISPATFAELQGKWAENDVIQQCHTSSMQGGNIGCRGHYEAARREELPYPLRGIWAGLGVTGVTMATLMQISERMGFVEFVDIETDLSSEER